MIFPIEHLEIVDGKMDYYDSFLSPKQANEIFSVLEKELDWRQDEIKMFGKVHNVPRLQAWYADSGKSYSYSGIKMNPLKWHPELFRIKQKLEKISNFRFNSVLANYYRNGADSNGWHADNEKELGINPVIASISLGQERFFHLKHRNLKSEKQKLLLKNGSLLLMHGEMQHHWLHQIAKTKKDINPRINLTFRLIRD